MSMSLYDSSAVVFVRMLSNLDAIMGKAESYAAERKFSPDNYVGLRLAPDMHPFPFQIQSATDRAKFFLARSTGQTSPAWPDTEKSWAEIRQRLHTGLEYAKSFKREDIDGLEDKMITFRFRGEEVQWSAQKYLLENIMPNFYFHVTTAYALLRHAGLSIGKRDFTG